MVYLIIHPFQNWTISCSPLHMYMRYGSVTITTLSGTNGASVTVGGYLRPSLVGNFLKFPWILDLNSQLTEKNGRVQKWEGEVEQEGKRISCFHSWKANHMFTDQNFYDRSNSRSPFNWRLEPLSIRLMENYIGFYPNLKGSFVKGWIIKGGGTWNI